MKLNAEELTIGGVFGLCFWPLIHWLAFPVALCTSLCWAMTGAGMSKLYRRLCVPSIAAVAVLLVTHNVKILLAIPMAFGVLSMGYGIPDQTDKGSWLGREWLHITQDPFWANFWTRLTIYVLLAACYVAWLWR